MRELVDKVGGTTESELMSNLSNDELDELSTLFNKVPWLGPNETFQGPDLDVPYALACYWTWSQPAHCWRSLKLA